jgi:RimJ/RimL family protein N-acetyltransferase
MGYPGDLQIPQPDAVLEQTALQDRPTASTPARASKLFSWVPVRSLSERHRDRILTHLMALDAHDRYLRFGYTAGDEQLVRYVESLDFKRDELFGIFNRRLQVVGMAHLAYEPAPQVEGKPAMAEFGVSVLAKVRGRGFGARLFEHAVLHARNRGIQTLFIHALSENTAMLRIAQRAGATVEREGSEAAAWLKLPPENLASHVGEIVESSAAELDYRLKEHAQRVDGLLEAVSEVKTYLGKVGRVDVE